MNHLTEQISVGGQPSRQEIESMARHGTRSLINVRAAGEDDQRMSPEQERDFARESGMEYSHIPVGGIGEFEAQAAEFRERLGALPRPVHVHCHGGTRALAFTLIDLALNSGWTGEAALEYARGRGLEIENEKVAEFVKSYIDRRVASAG